MGRACPRSRPSRAQWAGNMASRYRTSHVTAIFAFLFALHGPIGVAAAQGARDWVTGFPREPVRVAAWPGGKKVAVSFVLFVEQFGFGQGPVIRPDLTSRNPDLTNEAFRQYGITFGNRSAACSRSLAFRSASR